MFLLSAFAPVGDQTSSCLVSEDGSKLDTLSKCRGLIQLRLPGIFNPDV